MEISGNTILITGGTGGIGLALAKKLVELDNEVIVTGRNQEKLDAAAAEVDGLATIRCDAAAADDVSRLGETIAADYPETNVLINNAGIMRYQNLAEPAADLDFLTQERIVLAPYNGLNRIPAYAEQARSADRVARWASRRPQRAISSVRQLSSSVT